MKPLATKRKEPTGGQVKAWLVQHGHRADKVNPVDLSSKAKIKDEMVKLHKPDKVKSSRLIVLG